MKIVHFVYTFDLEEVYTDFNYVFIVIALFLNNCYLLFGYYIISIPFRLLFFLFKDFLGG